MKNILDKIVGERQQFVSSQKEIVTTKQLEAYAHFNRACFSLSQSLLQKNGFGIIAEFKKASPSKGIINATANVEDVTLAYAKAGAAAVSILTEPNYFNGSNKDIINARKLLQIPILRKEFIVDEYQILEAKAIGADAILLIAACLSSSKTHDLAKFAKTIGLEVLLELHEESELAHICDEINVIGINNRNLRTFVVDVDNSLKLAKQLPTDKIKVAESGIDDIETVMKFRQHGYIGFLIGEHFMKTENPGEAFNKFYNELTTK
jgi:indole-3-glycerol phosphate synthase